MKRQKIFPGLKTWLLTTCLLILSGVIAPIVEADYNPPPDQKTSRSGTGSGTTRSDTCGNTEGASLTLFAPQTHIGQTTSNYPTFVWFIPYSDSFKMELRLFEDSPEEEDWGEPIELETKPGIMHYSLPQDRPGLVVGNTYIWQVTIICDPGSRSKDVVAYTKIKVLPKPQSLEGEGLTALDYAEESFWYDALEKALNELPGSQLGEVGFTLLQSLVKTEEKGICSSWPEDFADLKPETETGCSSLLHELANLKEKKRQLCPNSVEESAQPEEPQRKRKCELIKNKNWEWLDTLRWIKNLRQITS